jgi:hypothetical protein
MICWNSGQSGPLLRFGIEAASTDNLDQHLLPLSLRATTDARWDIARPELMVDRAVRNRSGNLGIIAALVVALLIRAVAGVVVSALNPR